MGVDHYENFPVASLLVPRGTRGAVRAIYRFARTADDLADEGDAPPAQRLAALGALRAELRKIEAQAPAGATSAADADWADLGAAIHAHKLPVALFDDLLDAFEQDVRVTRYADWSHLFDYCRRSANPVGRLMLALFRQTDASFFAHADAICTALQLINFWQDIEADWAKGRVYVPQSELVRFAVPEAAIAEGRVDAAWRALLAALVARSRALILSGAPLAHKLGGRVGFELRLVVGGGLRILERIDAVGGDVFRRRPVLQPLDWPLLFWRALRS
jgi:squalene synthase HpnC